MIDIIGTIILIVVLICDYFIAKSTMKTYKRMKEAKRKAMMWDARIK